uniref:protein-serine/threonine phosphatase n=1 Tax=Globisporangium ultimum (strain ATCC 200006 / CBS 805.95 / DAOM BR144) TaxID=431595 RepID=K3WYZ1_GLOUD
MPRVPGPLDENKFRTEGKTRGANTTQNKVQHASQNDDTTGYDWKEYMPPSPVMNDFAALSAQNSRFRKHMEDECVAIPAFKAFHGDPATSSFFGVYDGHGGDFCSKYAAAHFHTKLSALLESKFNTKRRDSEFSNHSAATSSSSSTEYYDIDADVLSPEDIETCYADAFASIDKELETFDESSSSGSTAVTCLIRNYNGRTTFHVANVGDSRAIFYSNGETTRLTVDHKATNQDEVKRIKALNGIIFNKRVGGVVAVTRALGQADEKPFISSAPHIESVEVVSDDSFLVLVSDGVTDVFSDEQVTQFIAERLAAGDNSTTICQQLLAQAKDQGSMDNMTAIVIRFGSSANH